MLGPTICAERELDLAERDGSTMLRSRLALVRPGGFEEKPCAPFVDLPRLAFAIGLNGSGPVVKARDDAKRYVGRGEFTILQEYL